MKEFLKKLAIFAFLLIVTDSVAGYIFKNMTNNAKGGYTKHNKYIVDKTKEDMLVFGSSRAVHHYNPQIIEDSLNISCYNCGQEGQCIILFYGWWNIIKEHYLPKVIVYDVYPQYDLMGKESTNQGNLGSLKGLYDRANVKSIFDEVDKTERIKMMCQMYRYNSVFHQIVTDYIFPIYTIPSNGFLPLEGTIDEMHVQANKQYDGFVNTLKITYWRRFIQETKENNVKLFLVISPEWYGKIPQKDIEPIKKLCEEYKIPLLDYSVDEEYIHNDTLFVDGVHLNSIGADVFTKDLTKRLKRINIEDK